MGRGYRHLEDDVDKHLADGRRGRLSQREQSIILMRFGLCGYSEYTQKQVADITGHLPILHKPAGKKRIIHRLSRDLARYFLS
jgi:DNA-directed RNA polymerase specialized sigma subunit